MSVGYTSILWNKQKKQYDIGIIILVLFFVITYFVIHLVVHPSITFETLLIRAFGLLALLLLHVILVIGPLSRIDKRFLILLYNRRHLGVTMFLMASVHGGFSIMNFHRLGNTNPIRSVFLSNLDYGSIVNFPFQVLGFFALVILALMATTSHDFWLKNLGPKVWKYLHMLVYVAYGLIILHVVLGAVQNETSFYLFGLMMIGLIGVTGVHIYTGLTERKPDQQINTDNELLKACDLDEIHEGRARIVTLNGERVAIFKYDNKLSAVNNYCRHQGGPLGEGKIVDGCITCPWHGYQYYPHNGQSPPPFTEKVETYNIELRGKEVWIDPIKNPEGTEVKPIDLKI